MVRLRFPCCHQLISDALGKGYVHELVAMHVPDLAPADAELNAAETMRPGLHPTPAQHRLPDSLTSTVHHSSRLLIVSSRYGTGSAPDFLRPCFSDLDK